MANGKRQRSLIAEFLVVMLGVLAALGLEQAVLDWQERKRVEATLLAVNDEMVAFTAVFHIRNQARPCIDAKLDALDAWLAGGGVASAPVANIGQPPYFFSSRGGWSGASAELLARHRGPEVARNYGMVYEGTEEFAFLARREQEYWVQLQPLLGQTGELDAGQRWRAVEAVAGARNSSRLLSAIAEQMLQHVDRLVPGAESPIQPVDLGQRPICLPLLPSDSGDEAPSTPTQP